MADFFVNDRTLKDLGWPHMLAALAERTRLSVGRECALQLPFLRLADDIATALGRVEEMRTLLRADDPVPLGGVEDVRQALHRASKQAVLAPSEILECARLIQAVAQVRRYFGTRKQDAAGLAELGGQLHDHTPVARQIEAALEPSGGIRDSASYVLSDLRTRTRQLHNSIKERIEVFLHDADFAPNLQDNYFSVRGDRYVRSIRRRFGLLDRWREVLSVQTQRSI